MNTLNNTCASTDAPPEDSVTNKYISTSIGLIVYKRNIDGELEYLMIKRKESYGFSDFFYGKHTNYTEKIIVNIVNEMTISEKNIVLNLLHTCYDETAPDKVKKRYKRVIMVADMIGWSTLKNIVLSSYTTWDSYEWGFPKGRRNIGEKDIECAMREFEEETGIPRTGISLLENIIPYDETFVASNYKTYKHKYYIAEAVYDNYNLLNFQKSEVSKMAWMTFDECIDAMRPYDVEKKRVITQLNKCLMMTNIM